MESKGAGKINQEKRNFMLYEWGCRIYQQTMRAAAGCMKWRQPRLLAGENAILRLPGLIKKKKLDRVLIVTGKVIPKTGIMDAFLSGLKQEEIAYEIYTGTTANPTIENVMEVCSLYRKERCSGIVAFGGGSVMDCAKAAAAKIARPELDVRKMKGILRIRRRTPVLFAVPTTAGTGSETTLAAVITDSRTHEKYAILDFCLIPEYAVLDPVLSVSMPKKVTAESGLDALTHAIEAYIGKSNTKETKKSAGAAVRLIMENLEHAYQDGTDLRAREKLLKASYLAGAAFTRAYVGNVHAAAHAIGGLYGVSHGYAVAVLLPHILVYYGEAVTAALAELAAECGIGRDSGSREKRADLFLTAVKDLIRSVGIPNQFAELKKRDIPLLASRAVKEANPDYPVPVIMREKDMRNLLLKCKGVL